MRWLLCAWAAVSPALASANPPPFPGGVLDSTGRTAYVRSSEGIAAIDLARGEVLWHRREAHVPLLVAGDRLYAAGLTPTNRLSVLAFDLASRAEGVFQTDVTDLPRWVSTLEQPGKEFRFVWARDRRVLRLTWQAQARCDAAPPKKASGRVLIDLDSGRVRAEPPAAATPDGLAAESATPPREFERLSVRWHRRLAGQLVAVVLEELPGSKAGDRRQRLVFRSWDARTGKEGASREMLRGRRLTLAADLDGNNLWLRDAGRDGGGAGEPGKGHWAVYSGLDGQEVARVPFVPGTTSATLVGRRAYCLAGSTRRPAAGPGRPAGARHSLHAIDLDNGKELWSCPLGR